MSGLVLDRAPDMPGYLAGLARNFDGWGVETDFAWWFRRAVGGPPADLLALRDGDRPVAGSAVSYRLCGEERELVAIMTGSWTDTAYRRRGLFGELLETSRSTAAARGAVALLAFAGADRASVGSLAGVSDLVHEAWLLAPAAASPRRGGGESPPDRAELAMWFHQHRLGTGFVYPDGVFAEQLRLDRPETIVTSLGAGYWAICHDRRLLAVVSDHPPAPEPMGERLAGCGLPAYTTAAGVARAAVSAAMVSHAAFVFVIGVGPALPGSLVSTLDLQAVDRA